MDTTKVYLDVPNDIHFKIEQIQLNRKQKGEKVNLKDLYYEVLRKGLGLETPGKSEQK